MHMYAIPYILLGRLLLLIVEALARVKHRFAVQLLYLASPRRAEGVDGVALVRLKRTGPWPSVRALQRQRRKGRGMPPAPVLTGRRSSLRRRPRPPPWSARAWQGLGLRCRRAPRLPGGAAWAAGAAARAPAGARAARSERSRSRWAGSSRGGGPSRRAGCRRAACSRGAAPPRRAAAAAAAAAMARRARAAAPLSAAAEERGCAGAARRLRLMPQPDAPTGPLAAAAGSVAAAEAARAERVSAST